jgi:hypothetical protein
VIAFIATRRFPSVPLTDLPADRQGRLGGADDVFPQPLVEIRLGFHRAPRPEPRIAQRFRDLVGLRGVAERLLEVSGPGAVAASLRGQDEPVLKRSRCATGRWPSASRRSRPTIDVATSLNDLGALQHAQGRYGQAEWLYYRAQGKVREAGDAEARATHLRTMR